MLSAIASAPALAPAVFVLFACCLETAAVAAPPAGAGPAVAAGSVAQVVIGLAVVLALFGAIAWVLKRYSGLRGTGSGLIRIIGGAAVGQRERIVLVEVGGTWLLLGVAPGQVRALHTMPKDESAAAPDAAAPADQGFASWLRRMSEKRNHA
jgi:flagellar protein FliO/FliZ